MADSTELVSEGLSFKFQLVCLNRTLNSCGYIQRDGGMIERIEERTNGQVKFEISSFPELGLAGPDTLRLVEDGTLGMVEIYSGYVGGDFPAIDVVNLWGLIPDNETNFAMIESVRPPLYEALREDFNLVVVAEMYNPSNYFFSSKPLRTVADFAGMKTRSHSTVLGDLIAGLGAEAQFVAFSEVYTALERGIIDTAVSCGPCGAGLRWFEVSDFLGGPIVAVSVNYLSINLDRWNEMPADIQNIILEEGEIFNAETRVLVVNEWATNGITDNEDGGMEYIEFTPEVSDAIRQAAIDIVLPNWVERTGGPESDAVKLYNEYVGPILGVTVGPDGQSVVN